MWIADLFISKRLSCVVWCMGCALLAKTETTIRLAEAIAQKRVVVSISGAERDTSFQGEFSSHYGPCMAIKISNTTNATFAVSIEYGYKLMPTDTAVQTMMVSQTLVVKMPPGQTKTHHIYALCNEAGDGSPSKSQSFALGNRFGGNILSLAELLNRKKFQGHAAQAAVWCLTNNHHLSSISSEDTTMMYELRRFVARVKGMPLESIYPQNDEAKEVPAQTFTTRTVYSGSLSYTVNHASKVLIALFDEDNKMKRVYVNNELQHEGEYTYRYEIGSDEMERKKHYLRMFRNGKLEEEISILPRN